MKSAVIAVAAAFALPLAAAADEMQMPRMLKGMEKGAWRTEVLEHSEMKPGQKIPAMTMCTDNLMQHAQENAAKNKKQSKCTHKLLKDTSSEAIMEMTCPERTVTSHMKRESSSVMLMEIDSTRDKKPMHMKMRYTHVGPCKPGQATMTLDKDSEQCQKIRQQTAKMDPAKSCAKSGADREQCEKMMREQIARAKATCGG